MYLKSIEINGFKSFANKITFQFHNGITCIVGPNGSGKSNVADAVRWVFGEQKVKQLRSSTMQDVIFSGTQLRKPMSYAYVAITLDNSDKRLPVDYEEITVARRIYRSGESEYLMNGIVCRLRDVNELFYDTGIGKEGYSIIGQGQIDRILSEKPEDRRELFDEAAGIVKYKRRKLAASKHLEEENQNLLRVQDVLAELEKQREPLERQSDKARRYLKTREEIRRLDVEAFLLEHDRLSRELEEAKKNYRIAAGELGETSRQFEQAKEEYDKLKEELAGLEEEIETMRAGISDSGLKYSRLEGELQVLKEQLRAARAEGEQLLSREESLSGQRAEQGAALKQAQDEQARLELTYEQAEQEKEQARGLHLQIQEEINGVQADLEDLKNQRIAELDQRAAVRARLGGYDSLQEQLELRKKELEERLLHAGRDEEESLKEIRDLEQEFEAQAGEVTRTRQELAAAQEQLDGMKGLLSEKDQSLRMAQENYHRYRSQYDALVNLTERYEGYGGVKHVMGRRAEYPGILGVVADLFKVEKRYETAIETALGGSIQNIVTDTEETAKQLIAYLKETKGGRATFLPLEGIRGREEFKQGEVLKEKGILGMADSFVRVEERYRPIVSLLLGRIVVADHVDTATRVARKYGYRLRMVTLEGEQLMPGGSISGGAYKNSSSLLGRRRELAELSLKIRDARGEEQRIQEEIADTKKKRNEKRAAIDHLSTLQQQALLAQNTARINVEAARQKRDTAASTREELLAQQVDLEKQKQELEEGRQEAAGALAVSQQAEEALKARIGQDDLTLEELRTRESESMEQVSRCDVRSERLRQKQIFGRTQLTRMEEEVKQTEEDLAGARRGIEENAASCKARERELEALSSELSGSVTQKNTQEDRLREALGRKEQLTDRQSGFFDRREELSTRMADLDKEVYRLNAQCEKLEGETEAQINYMWEEYELTLSAAAALPQPADHTPQDQKTIKKQIATLKEELRGLGNVNVNAIEEYKSLMERYTFLKGQVEDLVSAGESLKGVIRDLDQAMRGQFKEQFSRISAEFDKVFKELFGGGKGSLELVEEEDILEAGIRIIAQPPGKKLQNMMQLSGGEKALTAISLLFAIQNLKPSPFCLLDEIEAALDDSNVARFADYLHRMTGETQYIVITHRRGTMEKADRLYGITMQEKGVSTMVSVSLIDGQLED